MKKTQMLLKIALGMTFVAAISACKTQSGGSSLQTAEEQKFEGEILSGQLGDSALEMQGNSGACPEGYTHLATSLQGDRYLCEKDGELSSLEAEQADPSSSQEEEVDLSSSQVKTVEVFGKKKNREKIIKGQKDKCPKGYDVFGYKYDHKGNVSTVCWSKDHDGSPHY